MDELTELSSLRAELQRDMAELHAEIESLDARAEASEVLMGRYLKIERQLVRLDFVRGYVQGLEWRINPPSHTSEETHSE